MSKKIDFKRLILLNLPYVPAFYFVNKIFAVFRSAPGTEMVDKMTDGFANFGTAFANPLPSFNPVDLLVGIAAAALLKLAVYMKGKNRKKFRQGEEYGSARWGKPEDIQPYIDPEFSKNVILTQTEALMMNSRPEKGMPAHFSANQRENRREQASKSISKWQTAEKQKKPASTKLTGFYNGGDGGIRTHGRIQSVKRFRVVPVMTSSIRLHGQL